MDTKNYVISQCVCRTGTSKSNLFHMFCFENCESKIHVDVYENVIDHHTPISIHTLHAESNCLFTQFDKKKEEIV